MAPHLHGLNHTMWTDAEQSVYVKLVSGSCVTQQACIGISMGCIPAHAVFGGQSLGILVLRCARLCKTAAYSQLCMKSAFLLGDADLSLIDSFNVLNAASTLSC